MTRMLTCAVFLVPEEARTSSINAAVTLIDPKLVSGRVVKNRGVLQMDLTLSGWEPIITHDCLWYINTILDPGHVRRLSAVSVPTLGSEGGVPDALA